MTSGMVRRGDRLLRPMGPWSPAVHEYLRYLEAAGFGGAPRVLGMRAKRCWASRARPMAGTSCSMRFART